MNVVEKRDFIHSRLHLIDENFINEMYQKMYSALEGNNPIVGYSPVGKPIKKQQLLAELEEAEGQIERGEYITLDELDEESKTW